MIFVITYTTGHSIHLKLVGRGNLVASQSKSKHVLLQCFCVFQEPFLKVQILLRWNFRAIDVTIMIKS